MLAINCQNFNKGCTYIDNLDPVFFFFGSRTFTCCNRSLEKLTLDISNSNCIEKNHVIYLFQSTQLLHEVVLSNRKEIQDVDKRRQQYN
jgi:hypothetical protein